MSWLEIIIVLAALTITILSIEVSVNTKLRHPLFVLKASIVGIFVGALISPIGEVIAVSYKGIDVLMYVIVGLILGTLIVNEYDKHFKGRV